MQRVKEKKKVWLGVEIRERYGRVGVAGGRWGGFNVFLKIYIYIYKLYIHNIFITFLYQILSGKLLLIVIVKAKK